MQFLIQEKSWLRLRWHLVNKEIAFLRAVENREFRKHVKISVWSCPVGRAVWNSGFRIFHLSRPSSLFYFTYLLFYLVFRESGQTSLIEFKIIKNRNKISFFSFQEIDTIMNCQERIRRVIDKANAQVK